MRGLIVVDVQNDFCAGGSLEVPHAWDAIPIINQLVTKPDYAVVVLTQDWHPLDHYTFGHRWPSHCVRGTPGAEFHPGLIAPQAQLIVRKGYDKERDSYSAFADEKGQATGLGAYLGSRGVNEVDVVGLALDYCVAATAVDAAEKYHMWVRVIRRGCAAIDKGGSLEAAMVRMKAAGVVIA